MRYDAVTLANELAKKQMTQSELTRRANLSASTTVNVIRGGKIYSLKVLGKIAEVLGVEPRTLILEDDEK